ncbi:phospholipid phosphatase 6-like [Pseudomyrmex gracilis]|uniref:phospholipid phosphatase 6-like n=1 Tax=Pseudomyrmex gracilis TaxID=219809 RepID=UPI00099550AA|nr:phospholipid phosphatase 6-like [Pseudomyrmex gracilis]
MEKKREVPSFMRKCLAVDAYLTDVIAKWAEQSSYLKQLKIYHKVLWISSHAIVWLMTNLALIWIIANPNLYQMQVNLMLGLILDIIVIAVLKALTRRRRPSTNNSLSSKKDSFPSGHSARAAFVVYFFINLWPVHMICVPSLLAWSFSVCFSALISRSHHIFDVAAGVVVGIFEGLLMGYLYLDQETCTKFIWWITDEKLSGPDYDV